MIIHTATCSDGTVVQGETRNHHYPYVLVKRRLASGNSETENAAQARTKTLKKRREHYDMIHGPGWTDSEIERIKDAKVSKESLVEDWTVEKWCNTPIEAVNRAADLRRAGWEADYLEVTHSGEPETDIKARRRKESKHRKVNEDEI